MRLSIVALCTVVISTPALAGPAEDIASARPTIEAVNAEWVGAMKAGDAARVASAYAPDAVFITADRQLVAGHDAIRTLIAQRLSSGLTIVSGGLKQKGLTDLGPGLLLEWGERDVQDRPQEVRGAPRCGRMEAARRQAHSRSIRRRRRR